MDPLEIIWKWLQSNYGKLVFLAIVVLIAIIIDKALRAWYARFSTVRRCRTPSIFVNILRVVVWVLAVATVLQPVFGVNPTTLFTALGIGGLAVSLGLKDTIANVIGGFGLMLGHVIQPGDYVSVSGTKGVVKDINWRQTIVRERNGNEMVIPNSILNTASLEKLDPINECLVQVPFTAKAGIDPDQMETRHHRRRREGDEGPREYAIPHKGKAHRILAVWHRRHGLCLRKKRSAAFDHGRRRSSRHRQRRVFGAWRHRHRRAVTLL